MPLKFNLSFLPQRRRSRKKNASSRSNSQIERSTSPSGTDLTGSGGDAHHNSLHRPRGRSRNGRSDGGTRSDSAAAVAASIKGPPPRRARSFVHSLPSRRHGAGGAAGSGGGGSRAGTPLGGGDGGRRELPRRAATAIPDASHGDFEWDTVMEPPVRPRTNSNGSDHRSSTLKRPLALSARLTPQHQHTRSYTQAQGHGHGHGYTTPPSAPGPTASSGGGGLGPQRFSFSSRTSASGGGGGGMLQQQQDEAKFTPKQSHSRSNSNMEGIAAFLRSPFRSRAQSRSPRSLPSPVHSMHSDPLYAHTVPNPPIVISRNHTYDHSTGTGTGTGTTSPYQHHHQHQQHYPHPQTRSRRSSKERRGSSRANSPVSFSQSHSFAPLHHQHQHQHHADMRSRISPVPTLNLTELAEQQSHHLQSPPTPPPASLSRGPSLRRIDRDHSSRRFLLERDHTGGTSTPGQLQMSPNSTRSLSPLPRADSPSPIRAMSGTKPFLKRPVSSDSVASNTRGSLDSNAQRTSLTSTNSPNGLRGSTSARGSITSFGLGFPSSLSNGSAAGLLGPSATQGASSGGLGSLDGLIAADEDDNLPNQPKSSSDELLDLELELREPAPYSPPRFRARAQSRPETRPLPTKPTHHGHSLSQIPPQAVYTHRPKQLGASNNNGVAGTSGGFNTPVQERRSILGGLGGSRASLDFESADFGEPQPLRPIQVHSARSRSTTPTGFDHHMGTPRRRGRGGGGHSRTQSHMHVSPNSRSRSPKRTFFPRRWSQSHRRNSSSGNERHFHLPHLPHLGGGGGSRTNSTNDLHAPAAAHTHAPKSSAPLLSTAKRKIGAALRRRGSGAGHSRDRSSPSPNRDDQSPRGGGSSSGKSGGGVASIFKKKQRAKSVPENMFQPVARSRGPFFERTLSNFGFGTPKNNGRSVVVSPASTHSSGTQAAAGAGAGADPRTPSISRPLSRASSRGDSDHHLPDFLFSPGPGYTPASKHRVSGGRRHIAPIPMRSYTSTSTMSVGSDGGGLGSGLGSGSWAAAVPPSTSPQAGGGGGLLSLSSLSSQLMSHVSHKRTRSVTPGPLDLREPKSSSSGGTFGRRAGGTVSGPNSMRRRSTADGRGISSARSRVARLAKSGTAPRVRSSAASAAASGPPPPTSSRTLASALSSLSAQNGSGLQAPPSGRGFGGRTRKRRPSTIAQPDPREIFLGCAKSLLDVIERCDEECVKSKKHDFDYEWVNATAKHMPLLHDVHRFVKKLYRRSQISIECIPIALVLINRYLKRGDAGKHLKQCTWIETVFLANMVAQKIWEDECWSNRQFAKFLKAEDGTTQIYTTAEINSLELSFLSGIGWDCSVTPTVYSACFAKVAEAAREARGTTLWTPGNERRHEFDAMMKRMGGRSQTHVPMSSSSGAGTSRRSLSPNGTYLVGTATPLAMHREFITAGPPTLDEHGEIGDPEAYLSSNDGDGADKLHALMTGRTLSPPPRSLSPPMQSKTPPPRRGYGGGGGIYGGGGRNPLSTNTVPVTIMTPSTLENLLKEPQVGGLSENETIHMVAPSSPGAGSGSTRM